MPTSSELRALGPAADGPLGAAWRADAESRQEAALLPGRTVVSCSAPYGSGGLGRHLQEIVDALDRRGQPSSCLCGSVSPSAITPSSSALREVHAGVLGTRLARLVAFSPAWRTWATSVDFDGRAARALAPAEHLVAFNGQALAQFRRARRGLSESISLVAANSHMRNVVCQHAQAYRRYPFERSWTTHLLKRNLLEYSLADRIYVASRYVWESFREEGFPEDSLVYLPLTPDPRYQAQGEGAARSDAFEVVYVGSLTVHKGVPLLVEAFSRLPHPDMRLVLVGGWATRGMRRFIEGACARDPRISVRPGDPLPHLRRARLYVHAAYEDGFAYAPAEALACGVPVIVSQDTGMKELIASSRSGTIVPTGEVDALTEAIGAAYRGEICSG